MKRVLGNCMIHQNLIVEGEGGGNNYAWTSYNYGFQNKQCSVTGIGQQSDNPMADHSL